MGACTPEDILWEAHELGIKDQVFAELSRIKHRYPYDLNKAFSEAFVNVTREVIEKSSAEDKQNNADATI